MASFMNYQGDINRKRLFTKITFVWFFLLYEFFYAYLTYYFGKITFHRNYIYIAFLQNAIFYGLSNLIFLKMLSPFCLLILKNEQDYQTAGKFYDKSLRENLKILQVEFNCKQLPQNIKRKSHNFSDALGNIYQIYRKV